MIRIIELVIIFHSKVDWVMFKNQDFSLKKLDFTETSLFVKGNDPIKLRQYQSFADALQRLDQGKLQVRCKSRQIMMYFFDSVWKSSLKNKTKMLYNSTFLAKNMTRVRKRFPSNGAAVMRSYHRKQKVNKHFKKYHLIWFNQTFSFIFVWQSFFFTLKSIKMSGRERKIAIMGYRAVGEL